MKFDKILEAAAKALPRGFANGSMADLRRAFILLEPDSLKKAEKIARDLVAPAKKTKAEAALDGLIASVPTVDGKGQPVVVPANGVALKLATMAMVGLAVVGSTNAHGPAANRGGVRPDDSSGFVVLSEEVPDVLIDARYYGTYNFIGNRMPGYEEPVVLLTHEAAEALKKVSAAVVPRGYRLKVFDGYRPQKTVDYFVAWAHQPDDVRMKGYFYPEIEKREIFPQGYVASRSGHTRGSTVDLTLFDMKTQRDVDMGCTFDYFGRASHPSVRPGERIGLVKPITHEQYENRQMLRRVMVENGFKPIEEEWWHFSLEDEPYPDTYFTFPVRRLGH